MPILGLLPLICAVLVSHIDTVHSQCSGTIMVLNATDTYQVFTSLNYPTSYSNLQSCEWRIEADNATDAVRLEITDAEIEYHAECVYDYGEVFDGDNINATSLGRFCGTANPSFVTYDSNMTVTFSSDYSMSKKGFKARYKCGPRESLVDEEAESSSILIFIIAGVAGLAVILIVVAIIIYKKTQTNKAKDVQPIQVQPFAVASTWSQRNHQHHPAPPAYGDGNASTLSPPPRYSDVGLHPPPPTLTRAGDFGKQDGVRNTHFVLPDNFKRTSTQMGNATNPIPEERNGPTTIGISNGNKPDSLPNVDNVTAGRHADNQIKAHDGNPENETTTGNANPPADGTAANTVAPSVNYPSGVGLLTIPRRNVPGESLSEVISDSEDETDSDDYTDSD